MKQTKIVASISDLRCDTDFIRELFLAGVNVIRMNTAHASEEGLRTIIRNTRAVSHHLGILIDTKGPEIRTTKVEKPLKYLAGQQVKIFGRPEMDSSHDILNLSYPHIAEDLKVGSRLLFDDGAIAMTVTDIIGPEVIALVENDGELGSHKSVNIPGVHVNLPAITEKDRKNILLAIDEKIDFIAHSFVRSAADVKAVQKILDEHGSPIKIISKIENQEGVDNIDEIIEASYGIMIARGDLGIEVPLEEIPGIQRSIIKKCICAHKPVIVATQMLHTMINNPRPTRAEVTDIATAVYNHTDALMLSGETASGKYPVEAVKTMARIAEQAEHDDIDMLEDIPLSEHPDVREFLSRNAIESTEKLGVKGIITASYSGATARNLSAFRGHNPVLAICYVEQLQRWLALSYGVIPVHQHEKKDARDCFVAALRMLRQKGYITEDDMIAYISGSLGEEGGTTYLEINKAKLVFDNSYMFHLPDFKSDSKK